MQKFLLFAWLFGFMLLAGGQQIQAQCGAGNAFVQVIIQTDNYGAETNWQLTNGDSTVTYGGVATNTLANATLYTTTFCIPSTTCARLRVGDSFGDGICCAYGSGYYLLIVDGDTLAADSSFRRQAVTLFNCPAGTVCSSPLVATTGAYTAANRNTWYTFTPTANGMYEISTCGTNSCDTRIWVYENCQALIDQTNQGTLLFNDNACGTQSTITAALQAGVTYHIRIGDNGTSCAGAINWQLAYTGAIRGCTDTLACNYNPLATVSDTCIYFGDPSCPNGPDLVLRQDVLANSLQLVAYNSTDACLVPERCVSGMGNRDIIRFTTHIENNGTTDYYVGMPSVNNPQFSNTNCHGHWHYNSYAEYLLFDQNGTALPIGMKNGFCVMDLVCDNGGTAQYGCSNMGITAGCGDIYDRSLMCQWVDVTTVPDGNYTLVVRVNWLHQADFLNRREIDYNNNWGQVCINLSRASGTLQMTVNTGNCPVYTDCMGVAYGSAQPDCAGTCNGTARRGDYDQNQARETGDVTAYMNAIVADNYSAVECLDLFRDTVINVYDAALLGRCLRDSAQCQFPNGVYNIYDTVGLAIQNVDFAQGYADILLRNPSLKVHAYQFGMSGIVIDSVVSLQPAAAFPVNISFDVSTGIIAALPTIDTSINRQFSQQNLCRVYFSTVSAPQICIDSIYAIVSNTYQSVAHKIESGCVAVPSVGSEIFSPAARQLTATIAPNPMKEQAQIRISGNLEPLTISIFDAVGKEVIHVENWSSNTYQLHNQLLSSGVYFFRLSNSRQTFSGKFSVE